MCFFCQEQDNAVPVNNSWNPSCGLVCLLFDEKQTPVSQLLLFTLFQWIQIVWKSYCLKIISESTLGAPCQWYLAVAPLCITNILVWCLIKFFQAFLSNLNWSCLASTSQHVTQSPFKTLKNMRAPLLYKLILWSPCVLYPFPKRGWGRNYSSVDLRVCWCVTQKCKWWLRAEQHRLTNTKPRGLE